MINPILPIAGVPDDLLRAINDRLREIDSALGGPGSQAGGQGSVAPGSKNVVPKFTGSASGTLTPSSITDDGKNVTTTSNVIAGGLVQAKGPSLGKGVGVEISYQAYGLINSADFGTGTWKDLKVASKNFLIQTTGGNVGIGTPSPTYPLSLGTALAPIKIAVYDNPGGAAFGFGVEGGFIDYTAGTGGGHKFYCNTSTVGVVINSSGWLGIGFAPSYQLQLSLDSAVKPSTSTWSVASDLRLKQNVEPVKDNSLAIIRALDWIRYEYNGLAQTPRGLKGVGLVAQKLQIQLPESVRSVKGKLKETDEEETDILAIDYHYILVHAARAIQALDAEVTALRALLGKER